MIGPKEFSGTQRDAARQVRRERARTDRMRCGRRFSGPAESRLEVVQRYGGCDHKPSEGACE